MGIIPAGMNFWDPWPIWEKLTFVLGCGIFFVLIIGFAVKFRNARTIRKLEARAAADLAERGEIIQKASEEVPFGIRAIEAGDEVDGIWNSRAATPLQAPSPRSFSEPSTPRMKPHKLHKARKFASESSLPKLNLPEAAHINPPPRNEQTPSEPSSHTLTTAPKAMHLTVPKVANTPCHPPGKRRIVIGGRPLPQQFPEKFSASTTSSAIEHMQAHRRQLSAETGQLERRVRRAVSTRNKLPTPASASDSDSDVTDTRTVSWYSSKAQSSVTPLSLEREVVPLPSPIEGSASSKKAPPTAWTQRTDELVEGKLAQSKSKIASSTIQLTPENLSHLNENYRKVNDGFEILPAGTLARPAQVKEFGSGPEPSIKMVMHEEPRPTRRLQKRDRSTSKSRRSSSDGELADKEN